MPKKSPTEQHGLLNQAVTAIYTQPSSSSNQSAKDIVKMLQENQGYQYSKELI